MPNWTYNAIVFEGKESDLASLKKKVKGREGVDFDFNKIIPMPDTMHVASGSYEDDNLRYYCLSEGKEMPEGDFYFDLHKEDGTLYSLAEYQKYEKDHAREYELDKAAGFGGGLSLEEGRKIYINLTQYGCKDWYEWLNRNWGTKWGACAPVIWNHEEDGRLSVHFETAWRAPYPIIEALSRMFPDVRISVTAVYEEGIIEESEYKNGKELSFTSRERFEEYDDDEEDEVEEEI